MQPCPRRHKRPDVGSVLHSFSSNGTFYRNDEFIAEPMDIGHFEIFLQLTRDSINHLLQIPYFDTASANI